MKETASDQQCATPESVGTIDHGIITRFRNSKAEAAKELEDAGTDAGIRFVERSAEYAEMLRLERWWQESDNEPKLDLEELGIPGIATILAGDNGDAAYWEEKIRRLGESEADDGRWIEGFVSGAVKRFKQIKPEL